MTANSPRAFFLSAAFHALVIAVLLLLSFLAGRTTVQPARAIFQLVQGEGDNYGARVAPKLGSPNGSIKLDVPKMPEVKPEPPAAPIERAAAPPSPVKKAVEAPKAAPTVPNFARQIRNKVIREESRAKLQAAKERAAEEKRLKEEEKRMSKAEFDRLNKARAGDTKVARIDPKGIAKGVTEGSTENDVGGAGGRALRNDSDDLLAAYDALFIQRLRERFEPPPGLSDTLKGQFEIRSNPDGSITGIRVVTSSGNREFDQAVLAAIRQVPMPARPDHKSEVVRFFFTMKEQSEG